MGKSVSYYHAVNSGDLIAMLPGMRQHYRRFGKKAIIYQKLNHPGNYMNNYPHPCVDENGVKVTMTAGMLNLLRPLIVAQEYVEDLVAYDGQHYDIDLHRVHNGVFVNMPYGPISMWPWYIFPTMRCDLSEPWITVPPNKGLNVSGVNNRYPRKLEDCLVLNFTERYRNDAITYQFLRKYSPNLVFAGTDHEYKDFTRKWKLDIPYLQVNDFLELAQAIAGAKGFLGNQSMCWNIAEALKVRRACEYFKFAPNCFPFGKNGALFLYQGDVEDWVMELMNEGKSTLPCPVCETNNSASFTKQEVDYYRCNNCGTLYSKYLDQGDMVGGLHENETTVRAEQNQGRIERIKSLGCITVLDFGCGRGELVEAASNSGLQMLGYDKYSKDYNLLPAGEFDCVTMIEVIEHIYAPFEELDMVNESLKQGGYLYVETSFADFLTMGDDYVDPAKGHCCIWSYKGMDAQMQQHGFELATVINRNTRVYRKI